jgi:hypothetical protein
MLVFESSRKFDQPIKTLEPLIYLRELGYEFFHVAWLRKEGSTEFFIGDDADPNATEVETLALVGFDLEERFLRPDGMNIFACPIGKRDALKNKFKTVKGD